MFGKLVAITALVGTAAAFGGKVASWTETGALDHNDYFNFDWKFLAEAAYTTTYGAGPSAANHDFQYEEFGVNLFSWVNVTLNVEVWEQWKGSVMFSLIPFDITPYTQRLVWVRPERVFVDGKNFDFGVGAWRDSKLFWFVTTFTEGFKTTQKSFVDYLQNTDSYKPYPENHSDFKYDDEWYTRIYEDHYFNWKPVDTNLATKDYMSWYGKHTYYTQWTMGNNYGNM
jgi:hypothetical protein